MSLEERMTGATSQNKPIDNEFCKRLGMRETRRDVWLLQQPGLLVEVVGDLVYITDEQGDCVELPQISTQGRFLHLLRALGFEVPDGF